MRRWSWLRGLKRNTRKAGGGSRLRNTRLRLEPLEQRSLLSASASLSIFVDGDAVALPANIGVASDGTLAEVYTSDSDGTLQIPDSSSSVTLEDFFAVWRTNAGQAGNRTDASFDSTGVLGNVIDSSHFLQMFVNGMASRELEDYTIQDGDEIAIIYTSHEVVSLNTNFGSLLLELYSDAAPGRGTWPTARQIGQRNCLPANSSFARNGRPHFRHTTTRLITPSFHQTE